MERRGWRGLRGEMWPPEELKLRNFPGDLLLFCPAGLVLLTSSQRCNAWLRVITAELRTVHPD